MTNNQREEIAKEIRALDKGIILGEMTYNLFADYVIKKIAEAEKRGIESVALLIQKAANDAESMHDYAIATDSLKILVEGFVLENQKPEEVK